MDTELEIVPLGKPIKNVTIVFEDGTRAIVDQYALVGFDGDMWYTVVNTPAKYNDQVDMNNQLVKMSDDILEHLDQADKKRKK